MAFDRRRPGTEAARPATAEETTVTTALEAVARRRVTAPCQPPPRRPLPL